MPGGSGMTPSTFVPVIPSEGSPTGFQVLQPTDTQALFSPTTLQIRTPALFGLGALERSACLESPCGRLGFGYLGRVASLEEFVAIAFRTELGVTLPDPGGPLHHDTPNISDQDVNDVANFVRNLAPPPRTTSFDDTAPGFEIFRRIGCADCHVPSRAQSPLAHLVQPQAIFPFGGTTLRRVRPDKSYAVKTPALWGLAYTGPPYLHDGKAASISEAIELHSDQAEEVKNKYRRLSPLEAEALLSFLKDL